MEGGSRAPTLRRSPPPPPSYLLTISPVSAPLYLAAGPRVTCEDVPGVTGLRDSDSCSSVQLRSAAQQPRRAGLGWHQQCSTGGSVRSTAVSWILAAPPHTTAMTGDEARPREAGMEDEVSSSRQ